MTAVAATASTASTASAALDDARRAAYAALDPALRRTALLRMHLIRRFEETAEASYMRGLVHGTMHLSIGQEASAVGSVLPLRTDALAQDALPLGLAQGAKVTRSIRAGDYLTYANCAPDERLSIVRLRRLQDEFVRVAAAA